MEQLTAVNYLLNVIGSSAIGDLETLHPDAAVAKLRLDEANKGLQEEGWWFNQEYKYELLPDGNKEIHLPLNTLEADITSRRGVVQRGTKLYDTISHSYQFDDQVTANLTIKLDWELLDSVVQETIKYFAGMLICQIDLEDTIKENGQAKLFTAKLANMKKTHLRVTRRNILSSPASLAARSRVRPFKSGSGNNPLYPGG